MTQSISVSISVSIAAWYTASWQNWRILARENPEIDPNRIEIGDEILSQGGNTVDAAVAVGIALAG